MAVTTNYNWSTPDNTALVKDGASAIRTLGSSVDTTLKALSPGTTAGDLDYYTSTTAKTRIGIGTSGQVLSVSGGVPAWTTLTGGSYTQLATGTLSSTSVVLSSISQSYRHLYLVVTSPQVSPSTELAYRLNGTATNLYRNSGFNTGSASLAGRTGDTLIYFNGGIGPGTPATANNDTYTLFIENYASSKAKAISLAANIANSMADNTYNWASYQSATAITSLTLCTNGGTATLSVGTYTLFGVN